MSKARALGVALGALTIAVVLLAAGTVASAHDCANQQDCEQTSGYIAGISVIGGVIAVVTGVLGTQLGGGVAAGLGGATPGAGAGVPVVEEPPAEETPTEEPPAEEAPPEPSPAEPAGDQADTDGWLDQLLDDLFPDEPPVQRIPAEAVAGGGTAGTDDEALEGDPEIDELVPEPVEEAEPEEPEEEEPEEEEPEEEEPEEEEPEEEEPEEEAGPKPPLLETAEGIGAVAGSVKDAVDKVKDELDDLPIDEETKKEIADRLGAIGDAAEQVKDAADKAQEYINVLDENLQRTDKLGITEDSQNFLGWWRVTFRAAGELTQKFIDGVFAPVKKLLGEKLGEKAEEMFHAAVPVKEFGDELSKLPTSAAENVVNASQRGQIGENVGLVPQGDAGYIELDDLFPGRKWP